MAKKKDKTYIRRGGKFVPEDAEELVIPDEALYYVVSHYLQGKNTEGSVPVVVGISTQTVEDVLRLFVDWAARNGYIKNGIMTIGGRKVD